MRNSENAYQGVFQLVYNSTHNSLRADLRPVYKFTTLRCCNTVYIQYLQYGDAITILDRMTPYLSHVYIAVRWLPVSFFGTTYAIDRRIRTRKSLCKLVFI